MTAPSNGGQGRDLGDLLRTVTVSAQQVPEAPKPAEPEPEPDGNTAEASDKAPPEPVYSDVAAFVENFFVLHIERRVTIGAVTGIFWCPQWWAHPEAVSRLYSLWREWEKAKLEDQMSAWWVTHLDQHLGPLTSDIGPFRHCEPPDKHTNPVPLPTVSAPLTMLAQLPDPVSAGEPE